MADPVVDGLEALNVDGPEEDALARFQRPQLMLGAILVEARLVQQPTRLIPVQSVKEDGLACQLDQQDDYREAQQADNTCHGDVEEGVSSNQVQLVLFDGQSWTECPAGQ